MIHHLEPSGYKGTYYSWDSETGEIHESMGCTSVTIGYAKSASEAQQFIDSQS